jgi:predicted DsbA family dithiol-disulfide isomerase
MMKVEVWSDVMCPFCYIGKKHFEEALEKSEFKNKVELAWKSFQLDPSIINGQTPDYAGYLGKRKGLLPAQVNQMLQGVTEMAAKAGLAFNLDKAVVANSFDAHRLSHLAIKYKAQNLVEELLFKAHFTEGKDISDHNVLSEIGEQAGIPRTETEATLTGKTYAKEVLNDIEEAQHLGIRGVPFFVFNRKYAVSGAQPADVFFDTLAKSFREWQEENKSGGFEMNEGPSCDTDGNCK